MFAGAFVLGFLRPRFWWAWAVALGGWVSAEPLLAAVTRTPVANSANCGALLVRVLVLISGEVGAAAASRRGSAHPAR